MGFGLGFEEPATALMVVEEEEEEGARAGFGLGRDFLVADEEEAGGRGGGGGEATTVGSFLATALKKGWIGGGLGVELEGEDFFLCGFVGGGGEWEGERRLEGGGFGEAERGRFDEEAMANG